jgi:hypothetical protein
MSITDRLREMPPYRLLLMATLVAIVLFQAAAMVVLTRSQVEKAQQREAQERSLRSAAARGEAVPRATAAAPANDAGVMKVGYVVRR